MKLAQEKNGKEASVVVWRARGSGSWEEAVVLPQVEK